MRILAVLALGFLVACGANGDPVPFGEPVDPEADDANVDVSGTANVGIVGGV